MLFGGAGNDDLHGGAGNDTLNGGKGTDKLFGDAGDDTLNGGNGDDQLRGGAGNDTLNGGLGADKYNGGGGVDTADYSHVTGGTGIDLHLDNSVAATGASAGDTFSSVENVIGTDFDDKIFGTAADNKLTGGDGADQLKGGGGADTLLGGDGGDFLAPGNDLAPDIVNGGDGFDFVAYLDSASGVTVNLETVATGGAAAGDTLKSIEAIIGSDHDDTLTVGSGGFIAAGDGADTLSGSTISGGILLTSETLFGGNGSDSFLLHNGTGMDVIGDFTDGVLFGASGDQLIIKASEFAGITHQAGIFGDSTAVANIAAGAAIVATRASAQFIWDPLSSILYFDQDGTGTGFSAIPIVQIQGYHGDISHGGFLAVDEFQII